MDQAIERTVPPEQLIGQVPLFTSLAHGEIHTLLGAMRLEEVAAGDLILREGDPGDCLYIVQTGQAEIVKALGSTDERLIDVHGPGGFFGEMSLLDPDGLRTASARARTPMRLWSLSRSNFDRLLQTSPLLAYEMLRVLSLRLREAHTTTITDLRERNRRLSEAYEELRAAQVQLIEKEKLERELQVAREIQQSILPRKLPRLNGFDFGEIMVPARAVGGDLFDFIPAGRGKVGVVIGDVSDKGVPAAIFMALTRSLLRAEASRNSQPGRVLERVNRLLLTMNDAGMFVTLLYGILDGQTSTFAYARAGHELPVLYAADGTPTRPDYTAGLALGLFSALSLDERVITIPPGGTLLLYTDGATDAKNAHQRRFGADRLVQAGESSLDGNAQATCDGIWGQIAAYQGTEPQADDVLLLAIRSCSPA